jgi:transcriptional regulator with XRE-family HTH domain
MAGFGTKLRTIRRQMRLSLQQVEEHSRRLARQRGDSSYRVSASWLGRLERDEAEITVNKLLALAEIYNVPFDQLLRTLYPRSERQNPGPNPDLLPDETTLLPTENGSSRIPYLRAVIGKFNLSLDPMIPAGSIVQIDTTKREISLKTSWPHSLERPIYFLKTKDGYFCGWCELEEDLQWLTLIPHPLSSAPSRRWRYGIEVENLGRVVAVTVPLGGRV